MRDRDRATKADLFLEDRHHAAVAGKHVAEPDDEEFRLRLARQGLHKPLRDQL